MKILRWFTRSNLIRPHLRIAVAGTLMTAAVGMAFIAAQTSGPLFGKADPKNEAKREASLGHSNAFMNHFQTRLGLSDSGEGGRFDGAAQEAYDNRAYPNKWIGAAETRAAANAANAVGKVAGVSTSATFALQTNWEEVGPSGVHASDFVVNESTAGTAATFYSGRVTAVVIAPTCQGEDCKIFVGTAGGGVWAAGNALASPPNWHPSNDGIPSNAIGSIAFDPNDSTGKTLYVGTGEPNGSGDSEAGVGLYKSTNFGKSWALVAGSPAVATGRSIGAIAIDPTDPNHIFIGTAVARHGSSSVNGGRFTPPGSAQVGLYESLNGGATFTLVLSKESDIPAPGSATGNDFFRGGVSHIELYRASGETQVYASLFAYGIFRRSKTLDGNPTFHPFHKIFASAGGGNLGQSADSRTEFSLAPNGSKLRIYVGDSSIAPADFYRVNNANVPASALVTGGSNVGWTKLSNPNKGTPGFSSFNYCTGQCNYDMPVYSPPGYPNIVYIGGAMQYDEIFTPNRPSNGRAVQRSEDGGVHFTDMTIDAQSNLSRHPDQHALVAIPSNPNILIAGDDGGVWRINGSFTDASSQCDSRGLSGDDLKDCHMWLSKIPTSISSLNRGLGTLQYQSISVNPQNPLTDIMGGTQDNGTHVFDSNREGRNWFVSIFGDGGQSGVNPFHPNRRFHTFFDAQIDINFHGTDPKGWDWISDVFFVGPGASEPRSFYIPIIYDPTVDGTIFTGLQHVWRTRDNGGDQTFLDKHCNEFTGDLFFTGACGDWVAIGQNLSTDPAFGSDKAPGQFIVATERAPSDNGTLWAGLRRGRVFVTSNANVSPGAVSFHRIDTAAQPTRFVSGIAIDASNPNHAFISYSGYNAYAAASGTATGHVFEVTYHPNTHVATWSGDLAGGEPSAGGLGDQPITDIAVDWNTGDVFVSTDFGVFVRKSGNKKWHPAAGGLPPVAVYGLTIDVNARVLYAATHGRGAWRLDLTQ
jgi:hypothetical protein